MKKVYVGLSLLIAFLFSLGLNTVSAQCVPDSSVPSASFAPNPLPPGCVGQPYSEVVSFRFPIDTTVVIPPFGALTIPFDSFVVSAVLNIPPGLTYACNVGGSCTYVTNPPNPTFGCVTVSGTPTSANTVTDSITVVGVAYITLLGSPTPFADSVNISLLVNAAPCGVGTVAANHADFGLNVAPNPIHDNSVVSFNLERTQNVSVSIVDMLGRKVMDLGTTQRFAGKNQVSLAEAGRLPAGIYSVHVALSNGAASASSKIVIVN